MAKAKAANGAAAPKARRAAAPKGNGGFVPPPPAEDNVARTARGQLAEQIRQEEQRADNERIVEITRQQAEENRAAFEEARAAAPVREDEGGVYQFVLLSGEHIDEHGHHYVYSRDTETVVSSTQRLDHKFMNKFRFLGGDTSPGRDYRPAFDRAGLEDAPLAERLPHGQATQFSRDTDLAAVEVLAQKRGGGTAAQANLQGAQGEDVTDDFDGARDNDMVVFKQGRNYNVFDKDDQSNPLNEDALTRKEDVAAFIKDATE